MIVRRNGSTARELRGERIRLLVLQGREDASLFEAPAVDDSDDRGKCEESDHRDPCELLRRDMIGHQ